MGDIGGWGILQTPTVKHVTPGRLRQSEDDVGGVDARGLATVRVGVVGGAGALYGVNALTIGIIMLRVD